METLIGFLAAYFLIGTWGFWLLMAVAFAFCLLFSAKDMPFTNTLVLALVTATVFVANRLNLLDVLRIHWTWFLLAAALYLPAGALFLRFRWGAYASGVANKYADIKRDFLRSTGAEVEGKEDHELIIPDDRLGDWYDHIRYRSETLYPRGEQKVRSLETAAQDLTASINHHKARAMGWILYWPTYLLYHLMKDSLDWLWTQIKRAATRIYNSMRVWLQSVSDSFFQKKNIQNDFRKPPPKPPAAAPEKSPDAPQGNGSSTGNNGGQTLHRPHDGPIIRGKGEYIG